MDEAQEGRVEAQEEGNAPLSDERMARMVERAELEVPADEVVLEPDHLAGIAQINEPQGTALAEAIAAHFGVSRDEVTGFVVAVEYEANDAMHLSSSWSVGVPMWRLRGIVAELREHLRSM